MKKWLSLLLAFAMCFVFAACGNTPDSGDNTDNAGNSGEHTHSFSQDYATDADSHWHVCTKEGCDETTEKEAHVFDAQGKCVCGVSKKLSEPVQVVRDNKFANGFNVKGQMDGIGTVFGKLTYDDDSVTPNWSLGQWYCGYYNSPVEKPKRNEDFNPDYNILNAKKTYNEKTGLYTWQDASKTLRVNPTEGTLYARLEGTKEYNAPRTDGGPWPHLLMEYSTVGGVKISDLYSLTLNLDYTLKMFKGDMGSGLRSDLHCAQFPFYCVISNQNPNSPGRGQYVWFGACLFDNRQDYTMTFASQDVGSDDKIATGAFIYQVGQQAYLKAPVTVDDKIQINWDMLPFMKAAYKTARERGFLDKTEFEDLYATGGNFGWEITGTYDAAIQIDKFEIMAVSEIKE